MEKESFSQDGASSSLPGDDVEYYDNDDDDDDDDYNDNDDFIQGPLLKYCLNLQQTRFRQNKHKTNINHP